ncbi:MAG: DUF1508 domain-containing protein [Isosphaeraceae bacterium]|nr:DUF1508 domain-containing protein [Isosphaeraceae bacterium]
MLEFQIYADVKGEFRWRLRAGNNEIIATSGEGYKMVDDCKHAIELIRSGAASSKVTEKTTKAPKTKAPKAAAKSTDAAPAEAAAKPKAKKAAPKAAAPKTKVKAKKA